jgi:hypothetical protein
MNNNKKKCPIECYNQEDNKCRKIGAVEDAGEALCFLYTQIFNTSSAQHLYQVILKQIATWYPIILCNSDRIFLEKPSDPTT